MMGRGIIDKLGNPETDGVKRTIDTRRVQSPSSYLQNRSLDREMTLGVPNLRYKRQIGDHDFVMHLNLVRGKRTKKN